MLRVISCAVVGLFVFLSASIAGAGQAQLLYYFSELCEYCELWDEEVGVSYDLTDEARILPLRRVDLDEKPPADVAHIDNVVFTPTFIVYQDGREIGRVVGYIGPEFFWGYLKPLMEKVKASGASAVGIPDARGGAIWADLTRFGGKACATC